MPGVWENAVLPVLKAIKVFEKKQYFQVNGNQIKKGDWITLDGSTGEVFSGKIPVVDPEINENLETLMSWVDDFKKLGIRTNADTPNDQQVARDFGAEGIGLCRTEHMFFEGERIKSVRKMIVSSNEEERRKAFWNFFPCRDRISMRYLR